MEAAIQKNILSGVVRYVLYMPISKWKVSNHAHVKLTFSLCCVASKGHGIESLGDDTITATAEEKNETKQK